MYSVVKIDTNIDSDANPKVVPTLDAGPITSYGVEIGSRCSRSVPGGETHGTS